MAISKAQMQMIERKLDKMEIEAKRLRAMLIPAIKISKKEKMEIEKIKADMARGNKISGRQLIKEMRASRS